MKTYKQIANCVGFKRKSKQPDAQKGVLPNGYVEAWGLSGYVLIRRKRGRDRSNEPMK